MNPENTHKLMGFYMEVLILGDTFGTWLLLLLAISYRVYQVGSHPGWWPGHSAWVSLGQDGTFSYQSIYRNLPISQTHHT